MIVLAAFLEAQKGKEKEVEETLKAMVSKVQNETGAEAYTLHRASDDPTKFFFYEKYRDQEALDYHNATPHFKELGQKLDGLLIGPPEVEFYNDIAGIKR